MTACAPPSPYVHRRGRHAAPPPSFIAPISWPHGAHAFPLTRAAVPPRRALATCTVPPPTRVTVSIPLPLGVSLTETVANGARRVVVTSVRRDSPANGLVHVGDVVMDAAGTSVHSLTNVVRNIRQTDPRHNVTLVLERLHCPDSPASAPGSPSVSSPPSSPAPAAAPRTVGALEDLPALGVYAGQDATLTTLIITYNTNRKVAVQFAADDLKVLLDTAAHYVRHRSQLSANSAQLIASVINRLKAADIPLTTRFYNVTMTGFIQSRHPARAVDLFNTIEHPNIECFTSLAKAYSVMRRPDDAIALVPLMRARNITPNIRTYNALIASCVRGGKLAKARQLFSEMLVDKVSPNTVSWNIIINWHVQQNKGNKRLAGALEAFADMKASGVSPNVVTFTTLMKAYTKSGLLNKAEEVFAEMKRTMPARLDAAVYNTLFEAYSDRLDWRRCIELLDEMENGDDSNAGRMRLDDDRDSSAFGREGVPMHSRSFSRRRPWLEDASQQQEQQEQPRTASVDSLLLAPMDSARNDWKDDGRVSADAVSYSLVVKACAAAGRIDRARLVFDQMMRCGFYPPVSPAVVSLLSGYANTGRLGDCFEVLKSLKSWGVFPEVRMLSTVMHGCLVAGRAELALSVYTKFKTGRLRPDVVTGTLLVRAYGSLGEMEKMFKVVEDMRKRAKVDRPSIITYNVVIEHCLWHGRLDLALRALDMVLKERASEVRINRQTLDALVLPVAAHELDLGESAFESVFHVSAALNGQKHSTKLDDLSDMERLAYLKQLLKKVRNGGAVANGIMYRALLILCQRCEDWALGNRLVGEREQGLFLIARKDMIAVRTMEDQFRTKMDS